MTSSHSSATTVQASPPAECAPSGPAGTDETKSRRALRVASSLRFQTLFAALFLVLALSLFTGMNSQRLLFEGSISKAQSDLRQAAGLLNIVVAPYTLSGNLATLRDYLEGLLPDALPADVAVDASGEPDSIVYVVIADPEGIRMISVGHAPEVLPPPDEDIRGAVVRGIVHVRNSILLQGNRVGFLQFGMSTRQTLRIQAAMRRESALISIAIGLIALIGTLIAGWTLAQRIRRLIDASKRIADGQYETRADQRGVDEVAELAGNFNRMADAVRNHIAALERAQRALQELNDSLESSVAERTHELAQKNDQLARTIAQLREAQDSLIQSEKLAGLGSIVAGVAHELNTPIGNALLVATTLVEKSREFAGHAKHGLHQSEFTGFVDDLMAGTDLLVRNLGRAAELVGSFKHVAADQSSEQRRRFALREVADECLLLMAPTLRHTPHRIEVDIDRAIVLDSYPGPIGQILSNFVNNALLHAFDEGRPGHMRIDAVPIPANSVRLRFCDDGVGISSENLKHVFDPFFTTRLGQGGSGLGLHISYNLVTKVLGGTIEVQSAPGAGTTFILQFPISAPTTTAKPPEEHANAIPTP